MGPVCRTVLVIYSYIDRYIHTVTLAWLAAPQRPPFFLYILAPPFLSRLRKKNVSSLEAMQPCNAMYLLRGITNKIMEHFERDLKKRGLLRPKHAPPYHF